jgi:hypothetical protein
LVVSSADIRDAYINAPTTEVKEISKKPAR